MVVTASPDEPSVRAAIDAFWAGWAELDPAAILATIADRPDTILIGTDADEYWRGKMSLEGPFTAMSLAFDEELVVWEPGDPVLSIVGDAAWAVGRLSARVRAGGEVTTSNMRTTFILVRREAAWSIVHAHFSVTPSAPVAGY